MSFQGSARCNVATHSQSSEFALFCVDYVRSGPISMFHQGQACDESLRG